MQSALKLEFATVPPYLSAAFSIRDGNEQITQLIVRVAKEEMMHMTVVANLLNAIGVAPDIIAATPIYPFDLDVIDPPLELNLQSFSLELVENLFMQIETPEDPVDYPSQLGFLDEEAPLPETIGQFYEQIISLIENDTIPNLFINAERDLYKQKKMSPNFSSVAYLNNEDRAKYELADDFDFIITNKESAARYLTWIVAEGEGASPYDPLDAEGLPGHYYRFESIVKKRYLIPDQDVEENYSFSGGDLPFFPDGVHEFDPNAKVEDYAANRSVQRQMKRFNERYTEMIDQLQLAFNCPDPAHAQDSDDAYDVAIGLMRNMPSAASAIVETANRKGVKAGIPFQYKPNVNDA